MKTVTVTETLDVTLRIRLQVPSDWTEDDVAEAWNDDIEIWFEDEAHRTFGAIGAGSMVDWATFPHDWEIEKGPNGKEFAFERELNHLGDPIPGAEPPPEVLVQYALYNEEVA